MPKQNFKSHAKRKRELAKLDRRQAKDQKRAQRRADNSEPEGAAPGVTPSHVAPSSAQAGKAMTPKPLTLAEAVERWKITKVAKPARR